MMRPLIALMAVALAVPAIAQPSNYVVLGRALPEMNILTCNSLGAAIRQVRDELFEGLEPGCVVSRAVVMPIRQETSVAAFPSYVPSYQVGSTRFVQNRHDGVVNTIPIALRMQINRLYDASAWTRDGEQYYTWAFLPDEPYHSAFLAAQASRRQLRP